MCIKMSYFWDTRVNPARKTPKACGNCWRCRANKQNDIVGRSLCEASTSEWTLALTLTYAPRLDLAEVEINPRHFQLFIKSLRASGHKIRYLVAAEYGELRGRVHFHCVLFGKGKRPKAFTGPERVGKRQPIPQQKNCWLQEWPHGHAFADWSADERALRYVCKYLLKSDKRSSWVSYSKKPPLGHEFFQAKAAQAVALQVYPSGFDYLPPGGNRSRPYLMTGATRREYLRAIVTGNALVPRTKLLSLDPERARFSEWVNKALEGLERFDVLKAVDEIMPMDRAIFEMRQDQQAATADRRRERERVRQKAFDNFAKLCAWFQHGKAQGGSDSEKQEIAAIISGTPNSASAHASAYKRARDISAAFNNYCKEGSQ